ncbi:MAG: M28 family peptidase, partial [Bacteroidota bacterium]|nr:M28 family peptidase [Bacteroidota bacterium]
SLPVIYVTQAGMKKYFSDHSEVLDIDLNVAFKENITNGTNVTGYKDNAAASIVVIAAHYQTAVSGGASNTVKHGADDNASGIATLIELAKMLSGSKAKNNNYLFLALDGNDNGSSALSSWLLSAANNIASINYMVNLDMVGGYGDSKKLAVQGYSTSPAWKQIFTAIPDKKVELAIDSSNAANGPFAAVYKKEVPGLSFSSAEHTDYTTTVDDENKINYAGTLLILKFIDKLIETADVQGRIAFEKSAPKPASVAIEQTNIKPGKTDDPGVATTKTSVSLGVIPDKAGSQAGLKISGVTAKKIASKLGLQPGDVLTNLGTYPISDLKSYLQALSNFRAGDKTTLRIKRGEDDKEFAVEF